LVNKIDRKEVKKFWRYTNQILMFLKAQRKCGSHSMTFISLLKVLMDHNFYDS